MNMSYLHGPWEEDLRLGVTGPPRNAEEKCPGDAMKASPEGKGLQTGFLSPFLLAVAVRARAVGGEGCWNGPGAGGASPEAFVSGEKRAIQSLVSPPHQTHPLFPQGSASLGRQRGKPTLTRSHSHVTAPDCLWMVTVWTTQVTPVPKHQRGHEHLCTGCCGGEATGGQGAPSWTREACAGHSVSAKQATSCHLNECNGLSGGHVLGQEQALQADDRT